MLQHVQKMMKFGPFRRASINKQHLKERKKIGATAAVLHVENIIRTDQHYRKISNSEEELIFDFRWLKALIATTSFTLTGTGVFFSDYMCKIRKFAHSRYACMYQQN